MCKNASVKVMCRLRSGGSVGLGVLMACRNGLRLKGRGFCFAPAFRVQIPPTWHLFESVYSVLWIKTKMSVPPG